MKFIKTYESFKNSKNERLNEEFLSKLFGGLKNKLSQGFSNMFGSSAQVDKLIEEYKKEIITAQQKKKVCLKALGDYFKAVKAGGEKDELKIKELKGNIDAADKNYQEQVKLIKQKFDLKINDVIKEEKNDKIKNYIQLKKIEMQQDLLKDEMQSILGDDLKSEEIDDPEFQAVVKSIEDKTQQSIKLAENQKKALDSKEEKSLDFDIEKAKQMAAKDETYLWEESPMKDYEFKNGDNIEFFSKSNNGSTKATVEEDLGERLKIKTEKGNSVEINKLTVISSENFDKEKADKKTEEEKKTSTPEGEATV